MPAGLGAQTVGGGKVRTMVPVETWMHGVDAKVVVPTTAAVVRVVLDPEGKIPDANRADAVFSAGTQTH